MTNIKYFESQVFNEEEKISYSEALERSWYVACHFVDKTPDFAELIGHGKVDRVIYYNREWPDDDLLKAHLSHYKECPLEIVSSYREIDGNKICNIFFCNSSGQFQGISEQHFNFQGDITMEVRMNAERNPYGTIEYEYDASGEISIIRERTPDGKIISEEHCDD
ncbi:hypothetical protein [Anabaena sp. CCY 0017]|uniref:hypothetical protein n=1 Tax=Anabaena sp. CCY 0017 TaxID=3103866 RepID=UPI0039C66B34